MRGPGLSARGQESGVTASACLTRPSIGGLVVCLGAPARWRCGSAGVTFLLAATSTALVLAVR
jgi:hypothetical protein